MVTHQSRKERKSLIRTDCCTHFKWETNLSYIHFRGSFGLSVTFSKWCLQSRWLLNIATSTLSGVRYLREPQKCQNRTKKTVPATKPSNKMPLQILLFYCLSDFKINKLKNLKKPKQTHHKIRKRGFSRRRLVLKMWERAGKTRRNKADLDRAEEDLTTHTHTHKYSLWMHMELLPLFGFWGEFH